MQEEIRTILAALKGQKMAASAIESELGFSNGLLGKAAKGITSLSEEKMQQLREFYNEHTSPNVVVEAPPLPEKQISVAKSGKLSLAPTAEQIGAANAAMDKINKDYGAGSIMRLGDKPQPIAEVIPTGSLMLDDALGVGGFPRGRVVEIYGLESSGKTTLAISTIAQAQKLGGECAFIDAEHAFDPVYAHSLGVDVDKLTLSQPDYGEQGLEIADRMINTGNFSVVVIDSVAALIPKAELEGEMGDSKMGLHARLMSQALRKINPLASKMNTLVIFINQLREKIGVIYGSPYVTTGGNALRFFSSIRLDVSKAGKIMDGDAQMGTKTKVKVVKNKVAPPFKVAEFDIIFGEGIDSIGELVDIATAKGIIVKGGSWYSYNGDKLGQGRDTIRQLLKDNEDLAQEIQSKLSKIKAV
jgi:recombination protein RecA